MIFSVGSLNITNKRITFGGSNVTLMLRNFALSVRIVVVVVVVVPAAAPLNPFDYDETEPASGTIFGRSTIVRSNSSAN